jgi:maltodextrin utilization protein YvdJ
MRDDFSHGIGLLLAAIALPLLVAGMFGLNTRLMLIGAAVAVIGIVIRLARL